MRVLLFGTMGEIGPVVRDNLLSHGLEVALTDFPQNVFRDEPGYRRALLRAMCDFHPELAMPVGNGLAMARFAGELQSLMPGTRICVESPDKLEVLDSKVRCYEFARSLGILQPRRFSTPEEAAAFCGVDVNAASLPQNKWMKIIFKRDLSFGGHGVRMPKTPEGLRRLIEHQAADEPYLIEEFIEGTEYSVDAIRFNGITRTSSYRSEAPRGANGPATVRTHAECAAAEASAVRILDALDYNGICGFDFIVQDNGEARLLEANPRFTGGIGTQIESGFELPWMLFLGTSGASQL